MYAPAKPDVPVLQPNDIAEADGFLFGIPTRYGNMPTQVKAFWDATGSLWQKGALVGKMAGTFFSTSSQHGGQETTAFTFLTTLAHHGMIYVPLGYSTPLLLDNELPNGGSAYGAGTLSNPDGSRAVSDHEKSIGEFQGESFAKILKAYVDGRRGSVSSSTTVPTAASSANDDINARASGAPVDTANDPTSTTTARPNTASEAGAVDTVGQPNPEGTNPATTADDSAANGGRKPSIGRRLSSFLNKF